MKVLEFLSEALPLVFLLRLFYFSKVEALMNENTIRKLNGIDIYNIHNIVEEVANGESENNDNTKSVVAHARGKRFIAFPVGSSFSTAVCMTTGVIGNPVTEYLSMGLNWGIAYNLPNSTWVLQHANGFGPKDKEKNVSPQIKRRHRRDLYGNLEILINGTRTLLNVSVQRARVQSLYKQRTKRVQVQVRFQSLLLRKQFKSKTLENLIFIDYKP